MVIDWDSFKLADETYRRLMSYPGVHMIGLGRKEISGRRTDVYAIRVFVSRKLPRSALDQAQVIPAEIQGVPTDVVEQQEIRLLAAPGPDIDDTKTYRPLVGGIHVEALHGFATDGGGTLGCIARDRLGGQRVLLSNAHVLGEQDSQVGDEVGQPAMCSRCSPCCSDQAARVLRVKKTAHVDGAIAVINDGVPAAPQIVDIGAVAGVRPLTQAQAMAATVQVQKRGYRTGLTFGLVTGWIPKAPILTPNGEVYRVAEDSLHIEARAPSAWWTRPGDSGSVVLDMDRKVIALHFGGTPDATIGMACPIQFVQDELNIDILTADAAVPVTATDVREQVLAAAPAHADTRALLGTDGGRVAVDLLDRHAGEIRRLIRGQRRVMVAWRRNGGPGLLQALGEAAAAPGRPLPAEIDGRPFEDCVQRIGAAISPYATPALQADLDRHLAVLAGFGGLTLEAAAARLTRDAWAG